MAISKFQFQGLVEALMRVLRFDHPADAVMSAFFRENRKLGARDRQFISEGVYAILRRLLWLNALIAPQEPTARRVAIAALLRLQGHNLREIADHLDGDEKEWAAEMKGRQPNFSLAARADLPQWVLDQLGWSEEKSLALGVSMQAPAPLDLRVNTHKAKRKAVLEQLHAEGLVAEETPYSPIGVRLQEKISLQKLPLFLTGMVEVQDEGSQLLGLLVGAKRGELVVDFCAGAGGKTLLLGAAMANTGRVYAFDVSAKRLENLSPRLKRSGLSNVHAVLINDERDNRVKRLSGKIDRVLVDAPCSGLGTLRRNPDLKMRQFPESVCELSEKQASILESAAFLLKPGGRLVYSTCSLLRAENEAIVEAFLAAHPDFCRVSAKEVLGKIELPGCDDYVHLYPHVHGTDGFFAAVLEKDR